MTLSTTAQIDGGVELFYDKLLLTRAKPYLIHSQWGQMRPMPSGHAKVIKFRRWTNLLPAMTPLTEGVSPAGSQLAKTDLLATLDQYGDFIHITDVVEITNTAGEMHEGTRLLSQQMAETYDEIVRNVLTTCASTTVSSEVGAVISKTEIDQVVKILLGNSANFITQFVDPTTGVSTEAQRMAFWGTMNTDLIDDIETVTGFTSVANYPTKTDTLDSEWGSTSNVRWVHAPNAIKQATTGDAFNGAGTYYWLNIIGRDAYGITDLSANNAKSIIQPFGSGGTFDPLKLSMTMGWKFMMTGRVLNDEFMHILKVQHSA